LSAAPRDPATFSGQSERPSRIASESDEAGCRLVVGIRKSTISVLEWYALKLISEDHIG
jgi:hypothetical protein